MFDVALTD